MVTEGAEEVEVSVEVEGGITRNTSFFTAIQTSPILPSSSGSGSGDEEDYVPSKDSLSDSSGRTRNPFSFKKLFSCFSPSSLPSASGEGVRQVADRPLFPLSSSSVFAETMKGL